MRLTEALYPGMWLMRKMRFGAKLGVVFLVALLPLLFIVEQLLTRNLSDLRVTRSEVVGVHIVEQTTEVIRLLQAHRGQTNMALLGNAAAQASREQTRAKYKEAITEMERRLAESSTVEIEPSEWRELRERLMMSV